jgi:UDP-3-O-[3-hydroxymyristoyl] glucosamine N-acyltransferase
MKLIEFSKILDGTVHGNPDIEITGVSGVKEAKEGDITFLSSPKYLKDLSASKASCVLVKDVVKDINIPQLKVSNPYFAFAKAIEYFYPQPSFAPGVSKDAYISDKADIGKNVTVFPFSYISDHVSVGDTTAIMTGVFIGENTKIGSCCILYPNVVIRENVVLGDRVIIHSGTVVGSDGFGYVFESGSHYKIPQVGGVVIGDDVEIGSNVSIDRATLGNTIISEGAKIDNLVQIAHNVKIGEKSLIIGQVGIGGSTEIGSFVTLAGQVGVADHASIESGTIVGGQSGIIGTLTKGLYTGTPAIPHMNWLRSQSLFAKLPELNKRIKELEERLNTLEKEDK